MQIWPGDMNTETLVINLSGIYEQESFYQDDKSSRFIDLRDISGTNCYCDDEAAKEISRRIGSDPCGLHFIDNGNHHYLSAIFLRLVKEPFSLVVLDHHPDMQRPMFDILSCGGWVMDVIENNPYVRDVHIIGADRGLIDELDEDMRNRVKFYDIRELTDETEGGVRLPDSEFPVYLSIDKDVISDSCLTTNWDQGEASSDFVISFANRLMTSGRRVLGVDICGECAPDQEGIDLGREIMKNDSFNRKILEVLTLTL